MPSRRVTDAASSAPYLTHVVSHHGQVTLVPPDNNGRVRQVKAKNRNQRQEKHPKTEEDVRFNTGPRPLQNLLGNRGARRPGRQDRGRDDGYGDEAYPDYPPPSFLEAISTISGQESSNSATLSTVSQPVSPVTPSNHSSADPLPTSASSFLNRDQPLPQPSKSGSTGDDADSDTSSLEIIDMESVQSQPEECLPSGIRLEEEVRRDWINRRGVEFPTPPKNARGRTKSRARTMLDSDIEDVPGEPQVGPPQEVVKRRHMSLSPLRTFFPYRPMAVHDGAFSAHPSPNPSPYSSRSSLPFLSTTSLKMSLSTTSFVSSIKGENISSRKLLSFKGKERATTSELLDNWEVVERVSSGFTPSPEAIENPSSPLQSPTVNQKHATHARGVPGSTTQAVNTAPPADQRVDTSPHPLSLRDRKTPVVPVASRPRRRALAPAAPAADLATVSQGPVLVSVRTRKPPLPPSLKRTQIISTSALGLDSRPEASTESDPDFTTILQCALATPLPVTPIDAHCVYSTPKTTNLNAEGVSALVHSAAPIAIPISTSAMGITGRTSDQDVFGLIGSAATGDKLSTKQISLSDDSPANVRRHYPGRPLPQPPGIAQASVDTADANHENSVIGSESQTSFHCPEGLLINLEDDSVVETPVCSNPTIWLNEEQRPTTPSYTTASSRSSIDLLGSIAEAAVPSQDGAFSGPPPSTHLSSEVSFSQITDLDVLVSHIGEEEGRQDGSSYDILRLLSEFIGPATPRSNSTAEVSLRPPSLSPMPDSAPGMRAPVPNVPLLGNVQVERRRTTKDGRVKLKLSLIDAPVDKCGICLTQFKSGDAAQLGSTCRHAFHEKCLVKWLARSKTCPMCRDPLADQP